MQSFMEKVAHLAARVDTAPIFKYKYTTLNYKVPHSGFQTDNNNPLTKPDKSD